jgi:hypothetical protein
MYVPDFAILQLILPSPTALYAIFDVDIQSAATSVKQAAPLM